MNHLDYEEIRDELLRIQESTKDFGTYMELSKLMDKMEGRES